VSDSKTQPIEFDLERGIHLKVRWADGHESVIPLAQLRKACPCASCQLTRRERESNPLAVIQPVQNPQDLVTVEKAELIGNYALRICWKDGHDAGIYDFALLRSLG
jgi:ATP-binding protein involved in chromosome partitioning